MGFRVNPKRYTLNLKPLLGYRVFGIQVFRVRGCAVEELKLGLGIARVKRVKISALGVGLKVGAKALPCVCCVLPPQNTRILTYIYIYLHIKKYVEVSLNYCSQNGEIYIGPRIIMGTQI